MIYEYAPQLAKKRERLLCIFLPILGAALFFASVFPGMPLPWLVQMLAIGCFGATVMILSLCLMRSYVYTVEEGTGGNPDFIITEYYGRRRTVVCRVALSDVLSVSPYGEETKKMLAEKKGASRCYVYTGALFDCSQYLLDVEAHGERFFLRICADKELLRVLGKE